jgi:hypothetical protein
MMQVESTIFLDSELLDIPSEVTEQFNDENIWDLIQIPNTANEEPLTDSPLYVAQKALVQTDSSLYVQKAPVQTNSPLYVAQKAPVQTNSPPYVQKVAVQKKQQPKKKKKKEAPKQKQAEEDLGVTEEEFREYNRIRQKFGRAQKAKLMEEAQELSKSIHLARGDLIQFRKELGNLINDIQCLHITFFSRLVHLERQVYSIMNANRQLM